MCSTALSGGSRLRPIRYRRFSQTWGCHPRMAWFSSAVRPQGLHAVSVAGAVHEGGEGAAIIGLQVREHHEALQAARRGQTTEEFRSRYAAGAGIEGTHEQRWPRPAAPDSLHCNRLREQEIEFATSVSVGFRPSSRSSARRSRSCVPDGDARPRRYSRACPTGGQGAQAPEAPGGEPPIRLGSCELDTRGSKAESVDRRRPRF